MIKRHSCIICNSSEYKVLYKANFNESNLNNTIFSARRRPDGLHGTIVKCSNCGLVRTLEVIDQKRLKKLYDESLFNYDQQVPTLKKTYLSLIKEALKFMNNKNSVLEIGCGNGFMFSDFKSLGFKKVYGVEPSIDAIKKAENVDRKCISPTTLENSRFKNKKFDLICAFQVFDHINDPVRFLLICKRMLKKEGVLLLMNHNVNAISAKILGEKSPIFDIEHTYLYGYETFSLILKKAGFKIKKIYSPYALFTVRYVLHLIPLPSLIKDKFIKSSLFIFNTILRVKPGNVCVIAKL